MTISFTTAQIQLYKGLNTYVQENLIELNQFWHSDRLCIPLSQFTQMMDTIGYVPRMSDVTSLVDEGMDFISIENVLEGVQYWKNKQQSISIFLSKKSPKKEKNIYEDSLNDDDETEIVGVSRTDRTKSKYLKQHSKKQLNEKIQLQKTLNKVKNQSDYEITVKVGETNDICRKLKNGMSYIIDTKGRELKIIQMGKNGSQQVINTKKFESRYENYKRAIMNAVDEQDEEQNMEQDLKKVLVEVMCLSSQMRKQIKILQQKGISHA